MWATGHWSIDTNLIKNLRNTLKRPELTRTTIDLKCLFWLTFTVPSFGRDSFFSTNLGLSRVLEESCTDNIGELRAFCCPRCPIGTAKLWVANDIGHFRQTPTDCQGEISFPVTSPVHHIALVILSWRWKRTRLNWDYIIAARLSTHSCLSVTRAQWKLLRSMLHLNVNKTNKLNHPHNFTSHKYTRNLLSFSSNRFIILNRTIFRFGSFNNPPIELVSPP